MKKLLFAVLALTLSVSSFAQDAFTPGFDLGVRGGVAINSGELSPNASIVAGYQFTPAFTLRADISGWESKGLINTGSYVYKFNYAQFNADAVINVIDLFAPYKACRVFNPYVFAGIGANVRFNNADAQARSDFFESLKNNYLWDATTPSFTGRVGAGVDFRLTESLYLGLEYQLNALTDKYNSQASSSSVPLDFQNVALLGVKYRFGSPCKACNAAAALAAAEAAAAAAAAEAARLAAEEAARLAAEAAAKVPEYVPEPLNEEQRVFYVINRYNIRQRELPKLDKVIELLKENPDAKVEVCSYADKETGYPRYNMQLSIKRTSSVVRALKVAGIEDSRITANSYGDTVRVSEVTAENRVSIITVK